MNAKTYELLEHTADIRIRVRGKSLKELFRNAALAMFDIIAEKIDKTIREKETQQIKQKADSLEELFVNWLNELLSLSFTKELIFSDFKITELGDNSLVALASGRGAKHYEMKTEIKAATYHELKIEKAGQTWEVKVIFDV